MCVIFFNCHPNYTHNMATHWMSLIYKGCTSMKSDSCMLVGTLYMYGLVVVMHITIYDRVSLYIMKQGNAVSKPNKCTGTENDNL